MSYRIKAGTGEIEISDSKFVYAIDIVSQMPMYFEYYKQTFWSMDNSFIKEQIILQGLREDGIFVTRLYSNIQDLKKDFDNE